MPDYSLQPTSRMWGPCQTLAVSRALMESAAWHRWSCASGSALQLFDFPVILKLSPRNYQLGRDVDAPRKSVFQACFSVLCHLCDLNSIDLCLDHVFLWKVTTSGAGSHTQVVAGEKWVLVLFLGRKKYVFIICTQEDPVKHTHTPQNKEHILHPL